MTLETLDPSNATGWNSWLRKNYLISPGVWLVFHKKTSERPGLTYEEAMDEALAYGWIDSQIKKIDHRRYARKFTPRRPDSIWSKSNIERVTRLRRESRMTDWGLRAFEMRTSEISMLEKFKIDPAPVPQDLLLALEKNEKAWANFRQFTPSYKRKYTMWITSAKQPETRRRRISEAVILISRNIKTLLK